MFSTQTYQERRKRLKQYVGSGVILLLGNRQSSINYRDNHYRFRQDSTFLYYFGLNLPGLAALLDIDSGREILFGDDPGIDEIVFSGSPPSLAELSDRAGVEQCRPYEALSSHLIGLEDGRPIHFLPPYRPEHTLELQRLLGYEPDAVSDQKSITLIKGIVEQRSVKTEEEIACIEKAVTITGEMHLEAIRSARPGMKEYELMSRVHRTALAHDARLSFPIILTKNGQILHNHDYSNTIADGDMVLCDAGAELEHGYAGDLTRTFPAGKRFTPLQRELYEIVLRAQEAVVEQLKPGVEFRSLHLLAAETMTEGLQGYGLMKGDPKEAVKAGAHTIFFQCGMGHMMGLDVHDMENLGEEYVGYTEAMQQSDAFGLKSLRLGRAVEPGFVVTVEPGIYIIPELIDLWKDENKHGAFINYDKFEEFRDFGGIRIEDDYLVTEEGCRLLGEPIPRSADEIEAIRREAF